MNRLERFIYKLKLRWFRIKHKNNHPDLMYPKLYKPGIINYIKYKQNLKRVKEKIEDKLNIVNDYHDTDNVILTGNTSVALGIRDFPIPTGICSNPVFDELRKEIRKDKLGQLLNNPINQCIFCNKSNNYCFFCGDCKEKLEISDEKIDNYRQMMKDYINEKYGEEK